MNFFEHQDLARRSSHRLVGLFVVAVVLLILSAYGIVILSLLAAGATGDLWNPALAAAVTGGTLAVVGLSSLWRTWSLRQGGGKTVAEALGGRLVPLNTDQPGEKRLINVVQEMALAAGLPVPAVYLMDNEEGINAFAAGYTPQDAVIGVTVGAVRQLSRDQLQGVIAHEYSHILNGDMRLNIRLMGWIYGILVLGLIGQMLMRVFFYSGSGRSRRGGKNEGGIIIVVMLVALGLTVIGFVGTFFGSLIKAAISRRREYLADAAAVQFTRNPDGIAGALKRIGAAGRGSRIFSSFATETSHLFFSSPLIGALDRLASTHPPLPDRIRRIDPGWDGKFPEPATTAAAPQQETPTRSGTPGFPGLPGHPGHPGLNPLAALDAIAHLGEIRQETIQQAASIRSRIPEDLLDGAEDPYLARLVVFGLLLDSDPKARREQMTILTADLDETQVKEIAHLVPQIDALDADLRLPLVEIAVQSLKSLSEPQYNAFRSTLAALVACDQKLHLFEWMLHRLVLRHLAPAFQAPPTQRVHYYGLQQLREPCRLLLSALALRGADRPEFAWAAFSAGMKKLGLTGDLMPPEACGLHALDQALNVLETAAPKLKKQILEACILCINHDGEIRPAEAQLVRGISDGLGCPLPMAGAA